MIQLFVGLMAEGPTDYRFLSPIITRTLTEIIYTEVNFEIEINVFDISYEKEGAFSNYVLNAASAGIRKYGIKSLIIHSDADSPDSSMTYRTKIKPSYSYCRENGVNEDNIEFAALVPVYETESWMLANKELLKKQIGTSKSDAELGIIGNPESIRNPKEKIEEAIRLGRSELPRKIRKKISIGDLYSILGEAIMISDLDKFVSFQDFKSNLRIMLKNLNLLH